MKKKRKQKKNKRKIKKRAEWPSTVPYVQFLCFPSNDYLNDERNSSKRIFVTIANSNGIIEINRRLTRRFPKIIN